MDARNQFLMQSSAGSWTMEPTFLLEQYGYGMDLPPLTVPLYSDRFAFCTEKSYSHSILACEQEHKRLLLCVCENTSCCAYHPIIGALMPRVFQHFN